MWSLAPLAVGGGDRIHQTNARKSSWQGAVLALIDRQ
jgi:hypothetical protein